MQLTTLLLIIVAILTALSGVAVISGAHKGERGQAFLFFLTTMAALGWAVGVGVFLSLSPDTPEDVTTKIIKMYYIAAPVMCWGLMAYTCHKYRIGQIAMIVLGVICLALCAVVVWRPDMLYDGFELNGAKGNIVYIRQGVFYVVYGIYHFLAVGLYMVGLWYTAQTAKVARIKKANLMVLVGFTITGILALVFDFILPYYRKYDTVWVGILAMSIAWIFHYYAILRYRLLDLSSPWMKGFSHIIVMSLAAMAYVVIFFIIFAALFKVPAPSMQVIILIILMIVAVMLLFPALNELSTFIGSLSSMEEVDVAYIVKKLTALVGDEVNLEEVAAFLSDHLHFQQVGIVMGEDLYASKKMKLNADTLKKISKLKKNDGGIWLEPDDELGKALARQEVVAVAELRDSKGKIVGQVLFGKPYGRISIEKRDLVPVEVVMQVLPMVTHPGNHHIKKHLI